MRNLKILCALLTVSAAASASDPERNPTMIFDNECRMADDPEGEARKILLS